MKLIAHALLFSLASIALGQITNKQSSMELCSDTIARMILDIEKIRSQFPELQGFNTNDAPSRVGLKYRSPSRTHSLFIHVDCFADRKTWAGQRGGSNIVGGTIIFTNTDVALCYEIETPNQALRETLLELIRRDSENLNGGQHELPAYGVPGSVSDN